MSKASEIAPGSEKAQKTFNHYDDFFGPLYFEPYALEVAKRIDFARISVALEIAAGTGRVTRHLREGVASSAKLIASDISEKMLAVAKHKLSHLDIDWQMADAQQLPFADNSIDLVVCCFGYMFVPDKEKAFAEAYRVLKPGGLLLFTTWDKLENNPASYISKSIARKYLDDQLPEGDMVATSLSDEAALKRLLQDAGFSRISIEKVQLQSGTTTAKEAAAGLVIGGLVYEEIKKRDPALIDEIRVKLEKELGEKFGVAPMVVPISAYINRAWKTN